MQRGLNLYNTNSFKNLRSGTSLGWQATTTVGAAITAAAPITTEVHLAGSALPTITPIGTELSTEILMQSTDNDLIATITKSSLYISITLRILEPSIKDITADKEIIDFIETDERDIIQTQVI